MHEDFVRDHIRRLAQHDEMARRELIARVASECWPGGSADRSEPTALSWVRRWRPVRAIARIPVCSCADGRCAVCN